MDIKIGCDLVPVSKFQKAVKGGGTSFLSRVFSAHELSGRLTPQTLAGFFAAKEAVKKALGPNLGWKEIEIIKDKRGRPHVRVVGPPTPIRKSDVSISHDGDFAMAVAVFLTQ